jgi:hypothetical protein
MCYFMKKADGIITYSPCVARRHEVKDTRVPLRMHFSTFSFIFTTSNAITEYFNDSVIFVGSVMLMHGGFNMNDV